MNKGISGLVVLLILLGCSKEPSPRLGIQEGILTPCPDKPNCVSSQASGSKHRMPPLPYLGTKNESRDRIIEILGDMKRSKIVNTSDTYIHVQFRSRFWRFVDDVEFCFDDAARLVHFRSASRVGYYDFNVNRKRMSAISSLYSKR